MNAIWTISLAGDNTFIQPVVGESHYQDALSVAAGKRTTEGVRKHVQALLKPEPTNKFDRNAVAVFVGEYKVGHLSRECAVEFHREMERLGFPNLIASCDAVIVGGWERDDSIGHYGIKLDMLFPFRLKN